MKSQECKNIQNIIDSVNSLDELKELSSNINSHIENCKNCSDYLKISIKLKSLSFKYKEIDLWGYFLFYKDTKNKTFYYYGFLKYVMVSVLFVLLMIGINFIITKNNVVVNNDKSKEYIVSNNNNTIEVYDYENTDLYYYYEISMNL